MDKLTLELTVNQTRYKRTIPTRMTLADFLRHELELTGTHVGCEHGVCGACTVLFDGRSIRACLMLAVQAHGHDVTTIEGLATDAQERSSDRTPSMNVLQQAFMEHHALQCGFCTPGMLSTLTEFLGKHPNACEAEIREALSGNLCRCTGYENIVNAALAAADALRAATLGTEAAGHG